MVKSILLFIVILLHQIVGNARNNFIKILDESMTVCFSNITNYNKSIGEYVTFDIIIDSVNLDRGLLYFRVNYFIQDSELGYFNKSDFLCKGKFGYFVLRSTLGDSRIITTLFKVKKYSRSKAKKYLTRILKSPIIKNGRIVKTGRNILYENGGARSFKYENGSLK